MALAVPLALYAQWEGKHLVRTDRVRNVVVHYIAQLEPAFEPTYGKHQLMVRATARYLSSPCLSCPYLSSPYLSSDQLMVRACVHMR